MINNVINIMINNMINGVINNMIDGVINMKILVIIIVNSYLSDIVCVQLHVDWIPGQQ